MTFEGELTAIRFARWDEGSPPGDPRAWPVVDGWSGSRDEVAFVEGVETIRHRVAAGTVHQVNLTT